MKDIIFQEMFIAWVTLRILVIKTKQRQINILIILSLSPYFIPIFHVSAVSLSKVFIVPRYVKQYVGVSLKIN